MVTVRRLSTYAVVLAFVPFWACAGARSEDSGDEGTGGTSSSTGGQASSGGSSNHSGGSSNHSGGTSNSGGSSNGTGGVMVNQTGAGGSVSTGGTANTGGASTGGVSSGGTSAGGAGTGGVTYEGDCADKPTWATWHTSPDAASGDLVIFACTKDQSECEGYMIGEDYLFECTDTHANNCKTQKPEDGSAWDVIDSCENLGMGGMGGMGGGP
jgi:hypothetical protein